MNTPPHSHLLFDAANSGRQEEALRLAARHESFYKGDKEENKNAAPYLFEMKGGSPFVQWYFQNGWGQAWGVPVFTSASFEEVYRHFRRFLIIKTEEDQQFYFRFYDPRVLRIFLPTCDAWQIIEFFGPVKLFLCEDEDPEFMLVFSHYQGGLKVDRLKTDAR